MLNLPMHAAGTQQRKIVAVAIAMILNRMAGRCAGAHAAGMLFGALSDAEKRGACTVARQDIEYLRRDFRIGPVIDRDRNFAP